MKIKTINNLEQSMHLDRLSGVSKFEILNYVWDFSVTDT